MKQALFLVLLIFACSDCGSNEEVTEPDVVEEVPIITEEKEISIIDLDSQSRPYAIVVNNSTVAVGVQTGLQQAYIVYEFPVEGGLTRLMALYKDIPTLTVGTIRSSRHNFLDYAMEHDAIFVHYGWSHYAKDDETALGYDYINGTLGGGPFWRDNPEGLASEHTAYTSLEKISEYIRNKGIRSTTDRGIVLNYDYDVVSLQNKENSLLANKVIIPSSGWINTTYEYDRVNKIYNRFVNGNANIDYYTKEQFTAKNILVQKIKTKMASDNYYWDLETVGSGDGYFITEGYAVPIKWTKESREAKTKYTYLDGTEVLLNDGNTYIQLQSVNQTLTIE